MLQPCQDNYSTTFASYEGMRRYHEKESLESRWHRCRVNELHIEPLDKASPLYGTPSAFAAGISAESVEDTAENLGLAMRVDGSYYPVRSTAYKSLLDRAKISGSALPKLSRQRLASVLNDCLELYSSETLLLIRDEKISAAHSGDSMDYSVLPIDELLKVLTKKLDDRFPGSMFQGGYRDHSLSSASWTMPGQKEDLLGAYAKLLASQGKPTLAAKLVPAIRFVTSDTGIASAKVSAMLEGTQHPIHSPGCESLHENVDALQANALQVVKLHAKLLLSKSDYIKNLDSSKREQIKSQIRIADMRLGHINSTKGFLYEEYRAGKYTKDRFKDIQQTNQMECERLQIQIRDLRKELEDWNKRYDAACNTTQSVKDILALSEYRPEVIARLVDQVRVFENGRVEIEFRNVDAFERLLLPENISPPMKHNAV